MQCEHHGHCCWQMAALNSPPPPLPPPPPSPHSGPAQYSPGHDSVSSGYRFTMAPSTDPSIWNQEIAVPANVISYVDDAVKAKLPEGSQVLAIEPSGSSYWARTARIDTVNADGEDASYFIKVHQGKTGHDLVFGEFHAMKTLWDVMPEMVARPYGYGTYEKMDDVHFFLCAFHELTDDIPDIDDFPAMVAELHRRGVSSKGKFGFPYEVYGGRLPQFFPLTNTWEESFTSGLQRSFDNEENTHGHDEDMATLRQGIIEKVIPRLIRPLETGPNRIKPRLVHGDMWDGNCSVDVNTNRPVVFDATSLWAHNEYELGPWQPRRHKMSGSYIKEYTRHFPISEPAEDFEDRVLLYSMRFNLHASSLYLGNTRFRNIVREDMRKLVDKYPDGYEGYAVEKLKNANAAAFGHQQTLPEMDSGVKPHHPIAVDGDQPTLPVQQVEVSKSSLL
ncbi:Fructosamine kinase-domain-containing protein [Xylariomycetidae sp. FL0641]|nr:Fructosamine kinase-domain-containing protein [Xylariomycetidae sp. FL0641]